MNKNKEIIKNYLSYEEQKNLFNYEKISENKKNLVKKYLINIDKLFNLTKSIGAEPIFINQPAQDHEAPDLLFYLNYSLI